MLASWKLCSNFSTTKKPKNFTATSRTECKKSFLPMFCRIGAEHLTTYMQIACCRSSDNHDDDENDVFVWTIFFFVNGRVRAQVQSRFCRTWSCIVGIQASYVYSVYEICKQCCSVIIFIYMYSNGVWCWKRAKFLFCNKKKFWKN